MCKNQARPVLLICVLTALKPRYIPGSEKSGFKLTNTKKIVAEIDRLRCMTKVADYSILTECLALSETTI